MVILSPLPLTPTQAQKMRNSGSKLAATENVIDQPEAQNSRDQVADDAKGRETKEQGFHPCSNDHRGGHYQGSDDDAESKPVGNVLQGATQSTQIRVLESNIELPSINLFYDLSEPDRQLFLQGE